MNQEYMKKVFPEKTASLRGELTVPGDKSISHRAIMLGSIAEGTTRIRGFLKSADCISTMHCFEDMGIRIEEEADGGMLVHGKGLKGLQKPQHTLDTGNSGTTTRLISGILSGQSFVTHLNGDASIQRRPMKRIMEPLQEMGADISSDRGNGCAPLTIRPAALHSITFHTPVASAQVKSAILLAGLYADGETTVIETSLSRDHSERMLSAFGAAIHSDPGERRASVTGHPVLHGQDLTIPSDISSAAYFLCGALITPGSEILLKNVNTNPTRDGILQVIRNMGGSVTRMNERMVSGEPVADLLVRSSELHGTEISGEIIPTLIDEIPVIACMAAYADGSTIIRDAKELRVKESDRIESVTGNLRSMGADIEPLEDGMIIHGGRPLHGAEIRTEKDHRIAMAFAIAGLRSEGAVSLDDPGCVNISYPTFYQELASLLG